MAGPIPLGVREDGSFLNVLDKRAMWNWSLARAEAPAHDRKLVHDCTRPVPPSTGKPKDHLGVVRLDGAEVDDLNRTGWAVLYGPGTSDAIKKQLEPLIEYRRGMIKDPNLFKVFDGQNGGYTAGQSVEDWLKQFRISADTQVRPSAGVPFYVMIVASPEDIPFEFQFELDVYWGVGRLWLNQEEDYGVYARAVIEYETGQRPAASRNMAFFATRFERDNGGTAMICDGLLQPLLEQKLGEDYDFKVDVITGKDATRDRLINLYGGGPNRPAIYFCGTHGAQRDLTSDQLAATQGALIAEPWAGDKPPEWNQFMASRDVPKDADLTGTVHFLFACYGGGWPRYSSYDGAEVAPAPMVARLPQKILAKGGLAVFAHIDRAWTYSFQSGDGIDRTQQYEDLISKIMKGRRAGNASDSYNFQWSVLGGKIAEKIANRTIGSTEAAHALWIEHDDARNHILYGDPAVCLRG